MDQFASFGITWAPFVGILAFVTATGIDSYARLQEAKSRRDDANARRVQNRLKINQQHFDIWSLYFLDPELKRILDATALLDPVSVTPKEEMFVVFLLNNLNAAYLAGKVDQYFTPKKLFADIQDFFTRPVPKAAWKHLRCFQSDDFVALVDSAIATAGVKK